MVIDTKAQVNHILKVLRLKNENPNAEIYFAINSEEIMDEFAWNAHQIRSVELDWVYCDGDGRMYVGLDDIMEELDNQKDDDNHPVTEDDARMESKQFIVVYTDPALI